MCILLTAFAVTRAVAGAMGLHYVQSQTMMFWQFLDEDVLRHHLLCGLLHLHSQPPLFNMLVGIALKTGGAHYASLMLGFQLLLGISAIFSVYLTLTSLRVAPALRLLVCMALLLNPAAIAFEFDPMYTEVVYAMNCFIALAAVKFAQTLKTRWLMAFVMLAVTLTLVRSSHIWLWVAALVAALWWQMAAKRRVIAVAALLGVSAAMLWPMKNLILFHHFSSSTWGPYSMASHWSYLVARQPEKGWVESGQLKTFQYFADDPEGNFRRWLREDWSVQATHYPELDDVSKQVGGAVNWNSLPMLRMHDARANDVAFLLKKDPKAYLLSVITAVEIYFQPSTNYFNSARSAEGVREYLEVSRIEAPVKRICCGPLNFLLKAPPSNKLVRILQQSCLGAVLIHGVLLCCLLSLASKSLWADDPDRRIAVIIMLLTIVYGFAVGSLVEIGENMRFRFETEGIAMMVATIGLQQYLDMRARKRALSQAEK